MDISHGLLDSPLQCYGDFSMQPGYSGLRSDTVQILNGMRRLTHIFEAAYSQDILGDSVFIAQCVSIESHLDSFPPANDALSSLPGDHVYEACRVASLIYLRAIMHNIPFTNPANFPLMRDLRSALENSILHGWSGFPGALLWTLLIGAAAERMDSEEVFFAGHLSTTSKCIVLLWNDVQTVLKKFLWIEGVMEERATYSTEEN